MKPRAGLWFLSAWALTGCVSLAELRASTPVRGGTVVGTHLQLATCVMASLGSTQAAEGTSYQFQDLTAEKTASLVATVRFPGGLFYTVPAPLLELSFHQADEKTGKIEARRSLAGLALELRAWPIIEQCAGTAVAVSPPVS